MEEALNPSTADLVSELELRNLFMAVRSELAEYSELSEVSVKQYEKILAELSHYAQEKLGYKAL